MAKTDLATQSVSLAEAADLLKVDKRWVQQLAKDGWIEKAGRGRYPLLGLVQGYVEFLRDEARRSSKSASQSRVSDARAIEIEQRTAEKARQLIHIDEAVAAIDDVTGDFLQTLAGLPAQITRVPRERERIEQIVDRNRERLSDRYGKRSRALRAGGPTDEAVDEDDA